MSAIVTWIDQTSTGQTMSKLFAYFEEQDGASAAEYALILAIVGAAIAAAAIFLGNTIATAMNSAASCIATHTANAC
jgi:pilus assembly protein Flp/PilA